MIKTNTNLLNSIVSKFDDIFFWQLRYLGENSELYVSESIEKVTGYSPETFRAIKDKTNELIFKEDQPEYRKLTDAFYSNPDKSEIQLEYRMKRKDGRLIWVNEVMKAQRDPDGKVTHLIGMVRNVTDEQSEFLSMKKRIEELDQTNIAKDNFISILSHDLRAPFTSILGFSEILLNESSLSERDKSEYLNYIHDSSQNQLQLINYLLDWSRLQTNRMKIEKRRLHAQSVIFNCVSLLTGNAIRKNISIKVNISENFYIEADERLLSIVVTNILNNAIKYSREGDSVEITASQFSEKQIEFIITDEGIGISEVNKEKIFHINRIFSTLGTKGEKGTGLGLTLAKQIIQKHGGEIWFYSTEGVGTEFHFTVPASANTILLVNQHEDQRIQIINKLSEYFEEVEIVPASNGFEALQIVEKSFPSLIITDHDLPLMNGLKLAESIRKMNKAPNIPVIVILKSDESEMKKNYEEMGVKVLVSDSPDESSFSENFQGLFLQ